LKSQFQLWISESHDSYKPELAQLLYPVFTHLYLEMVCANHKSAAAKFLKKHQSTFLGNAEFANFIRQLSSVTTADDIARDEVVKTYLVRLGTTLMIFAEKNWEKELAISKYTNVPHYHKTTK
jgi:transcription initiation factor TFIID subunit 5